MPEPLPPLEACRENALNLLDIRPHAIAELKRKLFQRRKYTAQDIQTVIQDLIRARLLDDNAFARLFCESMKNATPPIGRFKAQLKLQAKGVPQDIIQNALAAIWDTDDSPESERALAAARRKWDSLSRPSARPPEPTVKKRQKLARFLASRGFSPDIISAVIHHPEFR